MKELIDKAKEEVKEALNLNLGETEFLYEQNNTLFDYVGNKALFSNDSDKLKSLEVLTTSFYLNNCQEGKQLRRIRSDCLTLQSNVLGELGNELGYNDNPIILPYQETRVFSDKENLDERLDQYPQILSFVNQSRFRLNNSVALVKADTPLLNQYSNAAKMYNFLLGRSEPSRQGFELWLSEKLCEGWHDEEAFTQMLKNASLSNPQIITTYEVMKKIEDEKGPLTALFHLNFIPQKNEEYLKNLANENLDSYKMLLESPTSELFAIHEDTPPEQNVINLNQLTLINLKEEDFLKNLYGGDVSLNDLVVEGKEIYGNNLADIREGYNNHTFSEGQINAMKGRSLYLVNQAESFYQRANQIKTTAMQIPSHQRTREVINKIQNQYSGFLLKALNSCRESLRYRSFSVRYAQGSEKVSSNKLKENPTNKIEESYSNCSTGLEKLKLMPQAITTNIVFNTLYGVKEILLNEGMSMGEKKVAEKSAESSTPRKKGLVGLIGAMKEE
jgi:hypothetical protein